MAPTDTTSPEAPTRNPQQIRLLELEPPTEAELDRMAETLRDHRARGVKATNYGTVAVSENVEILDRGGSAGHISTLLAHRQAAGGRRTHRLSRDALAALAGVSRRTIQAATQDLTAWGKLIERGRHPGRKATGSKRTYEVLRHDEPPLFMAEVLAALAVDDDDPESPRGAKSRGQGGKIARPGGQNRAARGQNRAGSIPMMG